MNHIGFLQINYQTADHVSTPALTQLFGVIDAATALGYAINHSNQPNRLMIDPAHLYDVAEALGHAIKYSPDEMISHLSKLTWPRYMGKNQFKTSIWPSAKRVTCWTFDISKSESDMTQLNQTNTIRDEAFNHLEDVHSLISVWRDTLLSLPPSAQVTLTAGQLSTVLSNYCEQLDLARTKF